MKNYFILSIILCGIISPAWGNDVWLDINLTSYHPSASSYTYNNTTKNFNQVNYGIGISYEKNDFVELQSGFFRNSYDKNSIYGAVKIKYDFIINNVVLTPGLSVGGVTGYENTEVEARRLQLVALPTIGISYNKVRLVVGYMPLQFVFDKATTDVITLQAGIKF